MANPIQAYQNTVSLLRNLDVSSNESIEPQQQAGSSFGDVLSGMFKGTIGAMRSSEELTMKSVTGQVDQITLSTAQNEADLALKSAVASLKALLNAIRDVNQIGIG